MIRAAVHSDATAVCAIYNHYVRHTTVTFEEEPVSAGEMSARLAAAGDAHPWLVWDEAGQVRGYAHASPWKSRCAYRYSVETSVYLAQEAIGRGYGTAIYRELIARLENTRCHSLLAGIALPNDGSIALHEKLGFKKIGQFQEVGYKFNRWIDVAYWELIFTGGGPV